MRYADQIPVTIDGERVGSAYIHSDGMISVHMTGPQPKGVEILEKVLAGTITALSIAPVFNPSGIPIEPNYLKLKPREYGSSAT